MKQSTRWEKGSDYIQLVSAFSVDLPGPAVVVSSSLPLADLPLDFREQLATDDEARIAVLRRTVERWAAEEGFSPA